MLQVNVFIDLQHLQHLDQPCTEWQRACRPLCIISLYHWIKFFVILSSVSVYHSFSLNSFVLLDKTYIFHKNFRRRTLATIKLHAVDDLLNHFFFIFESVFNFQIYSWRLAAFTAKGLYISCSELTWVRLENSNALQSRNWQLIGMTIIRPYIESVKELQFFCGELPFDLIYNLQKWKFVNSDCVVNELWHFRVVQITGSCCRWLVA